MAPGAAAATSWTSLPAPWYAPTVKASTDDAPAYRLHSASSVAVSGRYAYTVEATLNRLTVVDISDPNQPVVASSLQDASHMDMPTWIVLQGSRAYVTSKGTSNMDLAGSSLSIYDISDPLNPSFLGSVSGDSRLYGAYGLQVVGSTAYIAAQGCVGGTTCVTNFPGGNALTIVDVSNPAQPQITGSVSSLPRTQHLDSIVVVGNRAYGTAFYQSRLTSFDVSDPAHPTILGSTNDSRLTFANDVQVQGHYAYVVDQSTTGARLTVVDITNPASMPVTGSVLDNANLAYAYRVRINSRFAFVAAPRAHALTIVDLANPVAPQVVASVSDPVTLGYPIGFDLVGDTAYVGAYCPRVPNNSACDPLQHGGFTTVDVSAFGDGAPDTSVTAGPAPVTTATVASFSFTSSRTGSSFTCALDGGAATPCTSPRNYSNLSVGNHSFRVTATSLAGVSDPTPTTAVWTVNSNPPPDTSIDSAPPPQTSSSNASVAFSSTTPNVSFVCQFDGGSWSACTSPATFTQLADGQHDLLVAAVGAAGPTRAPPTPAGRSIPRRRRPRSSTPRRAP